MGENGGDYLELELFLLSSHSLLSISFSSSTFFDVDLMEKVIRYCMWRYNQSSL